MSLTDILVLVFVFAAIGAFVITLLWASRPPRKAPRFGKGGRTGYVGAERTPGR